MRPFIALIICFFSIIACAQTGKIIGKVIDKKNNEFVIGAAVVISGTSTGTATDLDGFYTIDNVEAGIYKLKIRYLSYKTVEITDVKVIEGKSTTINVSLEPDEDLKIDEVVITTARITNSESAVLLDVKKADQVVVAISSMQIQKSQDRDASEVARRLPGVTVIDNRFVMVRGLSERYNEVWLNNGATPSVEPDVKAFSFDLIPSQAIDRLLIYKTAAPELPGNFAGGAIKIFTKDLPEKNFLNVNYTVGFREKTTFKKFLSQEKFGASDAFGFGEKERAIPSSFPTENLLTLTADEITNAAKSFNNDWAPVEDEASIDHRFSINGGFKFKVKKVEVGNVTMFNYSNTNQTFEAGVLNGALDSATAIKEASIDTAIFRLDNRYTNNVRFGVIHNWTVKFNNNHKIEIKNLYNRNAAATTIERDELNNVQGNISRSFENRYNSRYIYVGQLLGTHKFFKEKTRFDWFASLDKSHREDPNQRRIRFVLDDGDEFSPTYNKYFLPTAGTDPNIAGRFYQTLDENINVAGFNFDQKIPVSGNFIPSLKAGLYIEKKEREFSIRSFAFHPSNVFGFNRAFSYLPLDSIFIPENFNNSTGYRVSEATIGSDTYKAENFLKAYYGAINLNILSRINLYGGVRIEDNLQTLLTRDRFIADSIIDVNIDKTDFLPSVNLSYNFNEKMLIRTAYGRTINRPEFRELAPFAFLQFDFDALIYGNPLLRNCYINNYDLRWEWYPSSGETFSVAAFYKDFKDPIENILVPTGNQINFTYNNADRAKSYGLELDARISLARFENIKFIRALSIVGNAAYIFSQISLGDSVTFQTNERPMQGQSPYIINTGLYYENDSLDLQVSLLYNIFGPRIIFVGNVVEPDIYEMPRGVLDLSITKGITKWLRIRVGAQDLLNQPFLLLQDINGNGKLERKSDLNYQSFRRGRYYTVGLIFQLNQKSK